MTPTKRRISASSSIVILLGALGILCYNQVGDLNLASYVQNDRQSITVTWRDGSPVPLPIPGNNNVTGSDADIIRAKQKLRRLSTLYSQIPKSNQQSPACHPHFQLASSNTTWAWSNAKKFQRIYFYHNRKAGGTTLARYFSKVAHHYGLEFMHAEWVEAEEPGTHDVPTFYVTHLREPVDRSISHFKYQGRWHCRDLMRIRRKDDTRFRPTEENAQKIESWNETGGHDPLGCNSAKGIKLRMGECAVDCYTQWFSGLSCPQFNISTTEQYQVSNANLHRYNFIVVLEMLSDPKYVEAVEKFFGVPGVTEKHAAFCEMSSHRANKMNPLVIKNETMEKLIDLNEADIGLYKGLADCLDIEDGQSYQFPEFDPSRFENVTKKVPYYEFDEWRRTTDRIGQKKQEMKSITITS